MPSFEKSTFIQTQLRTPTTTHIHRHTPTPSIRKKGKIKKIERGKKRQVFVASYLLAHTYSFPIFCYILNVLWRFLIIYIHLGVVVYDSQTQMQVLGACMFFLSDPSSHVQGHQDTTAIHFFKKWNFMHSCKINSAPQYEYLCLLGQCPTKHVEHSPLISTCMNTSICQVSVQLSMLDRVP